MRWATPSPTRLRSRTRHSSRPTTRMCRCSSPADHPHISVRRDLTLVPSSFERRFGPHCSAPGSVALANELGELTLKPGDSSFELVHTVAERRNLALDELPRAVSWHGSGNSRQLEPGSARDIAIVGHSRLGS